MNTVKIGNGLFKKFSDNIPVDLRDHHFVIVTDNTVKKLYANQLQDNLKEYPLDLISFPAGERSKSRETKERIETFLLKKHCGRDTCIIALGGGVVGDLAGFAASTYMRGIPYIQVPTSLLAIIDSSVGGKTGINTPEGKNLIGAFHHPQAVIADLDCLETLPQKHIVNGWIEALKIFMTCDAESFKKAAKQEQYSSDLIQKAVSIKSDIVLRDPHEKNLRAQLNFGHTIGHALEKHTNYKMLHGYAVGYGILVESYISLNRGLIQQKEYNLIQDVLTHWGIQGSSLKKYDVEDILEHIKYDKKSKNKIPHFVLLNGLGSVVHDGRQVTHPVRDNEIIEAFQFVLNRGLSCPEIALANVLK